MQTAWSAAQTALSRDEVAEQKACSADRMHWGQPLADWMRADAAVNGRRRRPKPASFYFPWTTGMEEHQAVVKPLVEGARIRSLADYREAYDKSLLDPEASGWQLRDRGSRMRNSGRPGALGRAPPPLSPPPTADRNRAAQRRWSLPPASPAGLLGPPGGGVPLDQEVGEEERGFPQVRAGGRRPNGQAGGGIGGGGRAGWRTQWVFTLPSCRWPGLILPLLLLALALNRRWNFDLSKGPIHFSWFNGAETNVVSVSPPRLPCRFASLLEGRLHSS